MDELNSDEEHEKDEINDYILLKFSIKIISQIFKGLA